MYKNIEYPFRQKTKEIQFFLIMPSCSCKLFSNGSYILKDDFKTPKISVTRRSKIIHIYHHQLGDQLPVFEKSPEEKLLIQNAIEQNEFIRKIITKGKLKDVIAAMYPKKLAANEILIREGEMGNHLYISVQGKFNVIKHKKVVDTFEDVRLFGELAILYSAKRLATIKAITCGSVWVLDNHVYQLILNQHVLEKYEVMTNFLIRNEVLKDMDKDVMRKTVNLLKSEFFQEGHEIVRQGDKGDKFYIINAGSVNVTRRGEGIVNVLKEGDSFGELALTNDDDDSRQATVTANPPGVECLTLTGKEFTDLIEYIKVKPKDSIKSLGEFFDIQLSDLERRKTLGEGGFGRVELVEYKKKKMAFALKLLKKFEIVENMQQEHTLNERKIQLACNSPFILKLYKTFKDDKCVFFLMEACLGGDLWHLLYNQRNNRFEEIEARFYVACVLEAIAYLHSKEIIYRDLKPENLLIAANGYLKLSDFGLAKKLKKGDKTFTFAGTPEYLAPEIVLSSDGYNKAADCWQIGVFVYEMLCRKTPFRDEGGNLKVYEKILSGTINFPSYVNLNAQDLIKKLCRKEPFRRLGMGENGIEDIRAHKWYTGFNWEGFGLCKMKPPFKPKLKGQFDTKYIPENFEKQLNFNFVPSETSGWDDVFQN